MKKKYVLIMMISILTIMTACHTGNSAANVVIDVISREQGSGTRTAFEELLEINTSEETLMTDDAGIKDGNGLVATYVARNIEAVGYVSFATLEANKEIVHGLSVDGVAPTAENVLNGSYEIARPFVAVYKEEFLSDVEKAFLEFLESAQGLQALESAETIVDYSEASSFDASKFEGLKGNMILGGSTSTERSIKAAAGVFTAMFPHVTYSYASTGSGSGIQNADNGTYSIGFSSRSITESELGSGLEARVVCRDGIVFIVNKDNLVENLSSEQVRDIYLGKVKFWNEV